MDTNIWRFLSACVGGEEPQHLFCAAEFIATADAGRANSVFAVYHQASWYSYQAAPDWSAIAMAAARYPDNPRWVVVAMSQAGQLWELRPLDRTETFSQIPQHIGLTNLATIGGSIYACGMGRILLQREASGVWNDLSAPWPNAQDGVIGFTSIAGLDQSLLYAVGWQGEVWTLSNGRWRIEDSPTNANLNAVALSPDGTVYGVGDGGAMLKGRQGQWDLIDSGTDFNLMDVCVHEGDVFACSDFEVFRLTKSGLMADMSEGSEDLPQTCLKLVSAGKSGLYSVGPNDVYLRTNRNWQRLA
jgi:hypothetical protein